MLVKGLFAALMILALLGGQVQCQVPCSAEVKLSQDTSTSLITYSNSTTFTVTQADQLLCITLTLNNIVGTTWSVTFPSIADTDEAVLTYNLAEYAIRSGESVFISVDSYNRLPSGEELTASFGLIGPADIPVPYDITVFLRADNADMAIVNNSLFEWTEASLPDWSGSIFFADVSPANSKKDCQHFSYAYELEFPQGLTYDVLVTTTGLDTAFGQVSDTQIIEANTTTGTEPILIHGNFTASKGYYEFRMLSEVVPYGVETGLFQIRATSISLIPTMCSKKSDGMSTGTLIGIIVGSAVIGLIFIIILGCLIAHFLKKKKDGYESFD